MDHAGLSLLPLQLSQHTSSKALPLETYLSNSLLTVPEAMEITDATEEDTIGVCNTLETEDHFHYQLIPMLEKTRLVRIMLVLSRFHQSPTLEALESNQLSLADH